MQLCYEHEAMFQIGYKTDIKVDRKSSFLPLQQYWIERHHFVLTFINKDL